jgi:hypothetical protein
MLAGDLYLAGDPELEEALARVVRPPDEPTGT